MFKLTDEKIFEWPVEIFEPHPSQLGHKRGQKAVMLLKVIDDDAYDALDEEFKGDLNGFSRALSNAILVGWKEGEIADEDGQPIEFSDESKRQLLKLPYVREAITKSYNQIVKQEGSARRKN